MSLQVGCFRSNANDNNKIHNVAAAARADTGDAKENN